MRTYAAAAALLAAVACVGPSRTDADYESKAANTAEAVASSVETARFGAVAQAEGRMTAAYLARLVAEAEEDALAAQQAFDSVQPPSDHADEVHDHLDDLVQQALDLLRTARIDARRGHDLAPLTDPLSKVGDALDAFEKDPR